MISTAEIIRLYASCTGWTSHMRIRCWSWFLLSLILAIGCEPDPSLDEGVEDAPRNDGFIAADGLVDSDDPGQPMADADIDVIDPGPPEPPATDCIPSQDRFEQEIKPIMDGACGQCHGETQQFGAVGHLTSYASLIAGDMGQRLLDRLAPRITDGTMPPAGQLAPSASERLAIADWSTCGAWAENNATLPNPGGFDSDRPVAEAPDAPPESADFFELRANRFHVRSDQRDHYECFYFEMPINEPRFIKRIETIVDDSRVLHHATLIPDASGEPGTSGGCADDNPLSLIYGWAPGQGALHFEAGGMLVEPGQRVTLQVHYNNGAGHGDVFDSSGVRIYHDAVEGPEVSMLTLGPTSFSVAPNSTGTVDGWCRVPVDTKMLYSFPHMHENGTAFKQVIETTDGEETSVISLRGWDFGSQFIYQTPVDIPAGTVIRTSCTYQNTSDRRLRFGPNTRDEMCFNFAYVSPPLPISYCNQSERPAELVYQPGVCAPTGADMLPAEPVFAPFLEGVAEPLSGGDSPADGAYVVSGVKIYLPSFSVAGFELDTDLSRVTAMGTAAVDGNQFAFDAIAEVQLVAGGLAFNTPVPISFSGGFVTILDETGRLGMNVTCGSLDGNDTLFYGYEGDDLILQVPIRLGPTENVIVVRLSPVQAAD